jgi:hypothetical protein
MNWLKVDDWWEMVILGGIILGSLLIVYLIVKLVIKNGGIRMKNLKVGQNDKSIPPCFSYVAEHTGILHELKNTLIEMEKERTMARKENSESNKATQRMIKSLAGAMDGMVEALQINKIGNGNLEVVRKNLASCYDIQNDYLINNL